MLVTARVPVAGNRSSMERVRRHTERWAQRLAVAIVVSMAVHVGPLLVARHFASTQPLDIDMHVRTVEIGLEDVRPGAHTPPPPTPAPVATPHPVAPPPPHVTHERPPPRPSPNDEPLAPLPSPTTQLGEPQMRYAHHAPHLVQPDDQLHTPTPDAGAPASNALPSIASAASDLAPMVPRGALFTLMIHSDRVRNDPNAMAVRNVLSGIPDWNEMLGGTQLDPLRDLDEIVLAAANPMGAEGNPPDWFVLARGANGSDAAMRRAVEEMSAQEHAAQEDDSSTAPSPLHPPALDGGTETAMSARPDAGMRPIWHARHGVEMAEVERYGARRSFLMLGNGVAAIALPGQVDALLSAMARRGTSLVANDDPRLTMLIEAEGVRNTFSFNTYRGPFPMPPRAAMGVYQQRDETGPTGAVELRSEWQYDSHTEAEHAREMLDYSRGRWHAMIGERLGQQGGLSRLLAGAAASLVGIDIGSLESAIDALNFRVEGDHVVIHADLDARQVRALLNAASLGSGQ